MRMSYLAAFGAALLTMTVGRADAATIVDFSADTDVRTTNSIVTGWGDQSGNHFDAVTASQEGPVLTTAVINGRSHPVLRFNGNNYLTAAPHVPATGTLFIVYSNTASPGDRRVIGWEDSLFGSNGITIIPSYVNGGMLLAARNFYAAGDIPGGEAVTELEIDTVSWGSEGVTLERRLANGEVLTLPSNTGITSVGDGGYVLHIGAPGDHDAPGTTFSEPFQGDLAALRVYDEQLSAEQRATIANALHAYWVGVSFTGTPGAANCHGNSVSALPPKVKGGLNAAASALGFGSMQDLQDAIRVYCKER